MNHENLILTRVAITMAPRLNNALFASLFQECGGISGFFEETEQNIKTLFRKNNLPNMQPERSRWLQMAEQELDIMKKHHIQVCGIEDSNYPRLLKHCPDAPLVLFYKGTLEDNDTKNIAIVGTRKATEMGKQRVDTLLRELADTGYHPNIISGLAYGIDIAAHTACVHYRLKAQAVLGHGLHMVYPASHLRTDFTDKLPSTQSNRGRHERGNPCCRITHQRRSHVHRPAGPVVQSGRDGNSRKTGRPYLHRV